MARAEVKVTDRGYRQLLENITAAKAKTVIRAGVFEGPPRDDSEGLTNAEIGAVHEFGLGHVPERSFIRGTVDANRDEIRTRLRNVAGGFLNFKSRDEIKRGAALFGEWFVGKMKERIRDGIPPALAPETIERKGSSTPLIDHGQLLSALTYDVKQGGGTE